MSYNKDKLNVDLSDLRDNIDAIDEQIIALLKARCAYVEEVGERKKNDDFEGSFIRPKRESDMIKHIVSEFEDSPFSSEAAANIWRTIISASLGMESPLNTAVHCPDGSLVPYFLAREYFGTFTPSAVFGHCAQMVDAVEKNQHTVGVVNLMDSSSLPPWWLQLALSPVQPKVFTCIPFVQRLSGTAAQNPFLAFGQVEVEETGDDISYIVASFEHPLPEGANKLVDQWLKDGEFRGSCANSIETGDEQWAGLIKLQGFSDPESGYGLFHEIQAHLMQISDGALIGLHFIGAHATPCVITDDE